jgi:hypothetical protein
MKYTVMQQQPVSSHPHFWMFQANCPPWTGEHFSLLYPVECSTLTNHEELPVEKHFQHIFDFDQSCQNLLVLGNAGNNFLTRECPFNLGILAVNTTNKCLL